MTLTDITFVPNPTQRTNDRQIAIKFDSFTLLLCPHKFPKDQIQTKVQREMTKSKSKSKMPKANKRNKNKGKTKARQVATSNTVNRKRKAQDSKFLFEKNTKSITSFKYSILQSNTSKLLVPLPLEVKGRNSFHWSLLLQKVVSLFTEKSMPFSQLCHGDLLFTSFTISITISKT